MLALLSIAGGELCSWLLQRSTQGLIADAQQPEQDEQPEHDDEHVAARVVTLTYAGCAVCCSATSAAILLQYRRMRKELRANDEARNLMLQLGVAISEEHRQPSRTLKCSEH